jgi:hypothetical protein
MFFIFHITFFIFHITLFIFCITFFIFHITCSCFEQDVEKVEECPEEALRRKE